MDNKIILEVKDLQLSFGKKVIFDQMNLCVVKQEITTLVGPSGIGKSSFLQTLSQMTREDVSVKLSGKILFNDDGVIIDLLSLDKKELPQLRQKIVYVSQHPDILPFSIFDNIAFGLRLQRLDLKEMQQRVTEALQRVYLWEEVKDRLHVKANMLSGGQQQRLILARALVLKPKILLLDEPTASLNEALALQIESLLVQLKEELSIVMISHFKEQVQRVTDRVFEMPSYM